MIKLKGNKKTARNKRGQTTKKEDDHFSFFSDTELIKLLNNKTAKKRTSAAKLLGQRKYTQAIHSLCKQLEREKALYARIAISEALGRIGQPALPELIKLLGKIGNNQHKKLPIKDFKKTNYPLPRDIAARTTIKIGPLALNCLQKVLKSGAEIAISEAIDAIGHISFYSKDQSSFPALVSTLNRNKSNQVITWKTIRALSAFPSDKSNKLLKIFLKSEIPALRWEAARSLGQIEKKTFSPLS